MAQTSKDAVRVVQGLRLVLQQMAARGTPAAANHIQSAVTHGTDLAQSLAALTCQLVKDFPSKASAAQPSMEEILRAMQQQQQQSQQPPHSSPRAATAESTSTVDPAHAAVQTPDAEVIKSDPLGWSQVSAPSDVPTGHGSTLNLRETAVPSSQLSRFIGFGSLAARMAFGAASEKLLFSSSDQSRVSQRNAERLSETLCKMRGAALKLGQMLSISDEGVMPGPLATALERVRSGADVMPKHQLFGQLEAQLGADWRSKLKEFDERPLAAASIGQVHRAVLLDGREVAMKIQYPGVAESIDSDLDNLKRIVEYTNLLPPGLFIDEIIRVARAELAVECDYLNEAASQERYRELVNADPLLAEHTYVPEVIREWSTARVLTSELVEGVPIEQASDAPQEVRNALARTLLYMTLQELFHWRFMQTDPNFSNFLYDAQNKRLNLIDFGAARDYDKSFVDDYMRLVWAAANSDEAELMEMSKKLRFLTGDETTEMMEAHLNAGLLIGAPFVNAEPFDFYGSHMTSRISSYGETFTKYRLTAPPQEVYSLHRKLAGTFLMCIKLKAVIPCRDILVQAHEQYKFDE